MSLIARIIVLLTAIQSEDLSEMSPVQRQHFADILRHWMQKVEKIDQELRQKGVLLELSKHSRE